MTITLTERPSVCATCFTDLPRLVSYAEPAGYALTVDNEAICYSCADKAHAADLANPDITRYGVYVSEDGKRITSWTGGVLGEITWSKNGRADRSRWVSPRLISFNVRTPDGRLWCGRGGGAGMCLNLRVMKGR